jgi:hypothetical protein
MQLKTAILLTGFVRDPEGGSAGLEGTVRGDALDVSLEPGAMRILPPGADVTFTSPAHGLTQAVDFLRSQDRQTAAGAGITFEQPTGDLGEANYASARVGLLEFRRRAEMLQKTLIEGQVLRPVWRRWIDAQLLAGRIPASEAPDCHRVRFIAPGWQWVDPRNEVEAEVAAIAAGLKSREEVVAGRREMSTSWTRSGRGMPLGKAPMVERSHLMTLEEAAPAVHETITVSTLRAAIRDGRLPRRKIGRRYYVTPAELEELCTCLASASPPASRRGRWCPWHTGQPGTHVVMFRGEPLASIKRGIERAGERAGIEGVTPHVLKHTAITWAIMNGLSVEDAAECFDTSPQTIRKTYWHHSPHHQERALEAVERRR